MLCYSFDFFSLIWIISKLYSRKTSVGTYIMEYMIYFMCYCEIHGSVYSTFKSAKFHPPPILFHATIRPSGEKWGEKFWQGDAIVVVQIITRINTLSSNNIQ